MGDNESDLSSCLPWRRSLRASQARRSAQARRRRRAFRGRAGVTLAIAGLTVAAGGALAHEPVSGGETAAETSTSTSSGSSSSTEAIQRALGLEADGVYGKKTRAAVRRFQRRHDLTVDGVAGPQTLEALGIGSGSPDEAGSEEQAAEGDAEPVSEGEGEETGAPGSSGATLERIAQCESGGDSTAVSADGRYRGKYQFDRQTWERMGGSGDPADASEAEQDRLAAKLLAERGTAPWPVCGGKG